jgi:hypothetical protein
VRFLTAITVALVLVSTLTIQASGQQNEDPQAFWETGNSFLNRCDENSVDFAQLTAKEKQTWIYVCDFWIQGIRQGIEMAQQIRPELPRPSPAAEKFAEQTQEFNKKFGFKPDFSVPSGNMCIPEDVAVNQLRLVVVQWMKTNPTKLGQHGAWLTYAALTSTYDCTLKKGTKP